jgi:Sortase domain
MPAHPLDPAVRRDDDTVDLDAVPATSDDLDRLRGLRPQSAGRRGRLIAGAVGGLLVVCGIFGAGAGLGLVVGAPSLPSLSFAHAQPTGAAADAMERSTPTRISIPSINVSAPIMPVGLAADGTIGTPPLSNSNLAGWYEGGPAPGQDGPAVIVGHVDGPNGESVFYRLGSLKPGETVQLTLANHRTAIFSIYSVEAYPKGEFPGQRIYGDYTRPGLRLITCGGRFVGGSTGYADNVVAYATLKFRG